MIRNSYPNGHEGSMHKYVAIVATKKSPRITAGFLGSWAVVSEMTSQGAGTASNATYRRSFDLFIVGREFRNGNGDGT